MKVSYSTHPILKNIEEANLKGINIFNDEAERIKFFDPLIREYWPMVCGLGKGNIKYITTPFKNAIYMASSKLCAPELFLTTENCSGVFLQEKGFCECFTIVKDGEEARGVWFYFLENTIAGFAIFNKTGVKGWLAGNNDKSLPAAIEGLSLKINFIKYSEVIVKDLPANKKIVDINCNYKNETRSNVQLLNSTWFTTLVQSEGFKVRGHFRLQPKKKYGEWTKELIWIKDFEKSGYTAPARKLQL